MGTDRSIATGHTIQSGSPKVSVVMGVYNGQGQLAATIDSILSQSFEDFEFIIINDGSTDDTSKILDAYCHRDPRIRVSTIANGGLTKALSLGCDQAKGEYIARQDVGDFSLPDRFAKQVQVLDADHSVVAVGAGCRRTGPRGEFLGEDTRDLDPQSVTDTFLNQGVGISHTVSMFRAEAYRTAGGYRHEFRCAQDTDLWYRMTRIGKLAEVNEVLFEWGIDSVGISSQNSWRQVALADLAKQSHQLREQGKSDDAVMEKAHRVSWDSSPEQRPIPKHIAKANAEHFIASQLYALGDARCRSYFLNAIRHRVFWIPPWAKLALSFLTTSYKSSDKVVSR